MSSKNNPKETSIKEKKKCGIIMPIASNTDYPKEHWKEVLNILVEAISETDFEARLVSDDVAIGLIHERIVNNIYNDEIVVCDVSSKNPNVMFELGLRLAFDKPTIIIKDEKTGYSFDTGVIEHLNYPSSLRFNSIIEFKKELVKKINATYEKSISENNFSPFLKSFGKTIVPAKIDSTEIPESKYILEKLESISNEIRFLKFKERQSERALFNNNEIELSSINKRRIIKNDIYNFIERNSHIDEKTMLELIEPITEEIYKNTGFSPNPELVESEIKSYYNNKKTK